MKYLLVNNYDMLTYWLINQVIVWMIVSRHDELVLHIKTFGVWLVLECIRRARTRVTKGGEGLMNLFFP